MLEVEQLSCERADKALFTNISFILEPGQLLQLRGANGSGKSTLLRILAGVSQAFDGGVRWKGQPIPHCYTEYAAERIFIGHKSAVKASLTPEENLQSLSEMSGRYDSQRCRSALERVGLAEWLDTPCGQLSAGQQRRVALARLLCSDARLWLLDEPLTALDDGAIKELSQIMDEHLDRQGMIVLSTHQRLPNSTNTQELWLS